MECSAWTLIGSDNLFFWCVSALRCNTQGSVKRAVIETAIRQACASVTFRERVLPGRVLTHMYLCCSKAPPSGDALLMQLFASLPSLPRMPLLQYTACMMVASYSAWLAAAAATPPGTQLMPQLLQMLTAGSTSCICTAWLLGKTLETPQRISGELHLPLEPHRGNIALARCEGS